MKKLNILRAGDQHNWAYDFVAREHARYTSHNMTYAKHDEVNLDNIDILYIHSPDITNYHAVSLPLEAKHKGVKVIGAYAGNPLYWSPAEKRTYSYADIIVTISPQTYSFGKFHYTNIPTIYMPESIDTKFFTPKEFSPNTFIVGWAGGKHKKIKRFFLAEKLDFSITLKDDWKKQRNSQKTKLSLDEMRDFYQAIDVLVVTSKSECQPRVVMEAMACGKPVLATDVGSMRMLLPKDCIVDVDPELNVIKQLNNKLKWLKENPEIRKQIGERNRQHISQYFSWKANQKLWDSLFENIANNNIDKAIQASEDFLRPFRDDFELKFLTFNIRPISTDVKQEVIRTFLMRLNNEIHGKVLFWLARHTCLESIRHQEILKHTNKVFLGVQNKPDASYLARLLEEINLKTLGIPIEIVIEPQVQKIKQMVANEVTVPVPMPVVAYLESLYGKGIIS